MKISILMNLVTREETIDLFMFVEILILTEPSKGKVSFLIFHYTAFIFGIMLPKYEFIEE